MTTDLWFESTRGLPHPIIHVPKPWTSADLARRLGVSVDAIRSWRQGRVKIPHARLEALLTACARHWSSIQRDAVLLAYGYVPDWLQRAALDGSCFAERFVQEGCQRAGTSYLPSEPGSSVLYRHDGQRLRRAGSNPPRDLIDTVIEESTSAAALPGGLWTDGGAE